MIMMASGKFSTSGHIRFKKNKKKTNNNPKINFYIYIFFFCKNLKTFYFSFKREKVLLPERRKITVFCFILFTNVLTFPVRAVFVFVTTGFLSGSRQGRSRSKERTFVSLFFSSSSSSTLCQCGSSSCCCSVVL